MIKQLFAAAIAVILSGDVFAADTAAGDTRRSDDKAAAAEHDAMKLCDKLAGTEREICMRQARENRRMIEQGGVGASPGGTITVESKESRSGGGAGTTGGESGRR